MVLANTYYLLRRRRRSSWLQREAAGLKTEVHGHNVDHFPAAADAPAVTEVSAVDNI